MSIESVISSGSISMKSVRWGRAGGSSATGLDADAQGMVKAPMARLTAAFGEEREESTNNRNCMK